MFSVGKRSVGVMKKQERYDVKSLSKERMHLIETGER